MPKPFAPCLCGCGNRTRRASGYIAGHLTKEEVLTATQARMLALVHLRGHMTSDNGTYNLNTARALADRGFVSLHVRKWDDPPSVYRWVVYPKKG